MSDYDMSYYYKNPDKYESMLARELSNECCVRLAEVILIDIRGECDNIIAKIRRQPTNYEYIHDARRMYRTLTSQYIDALTFGHGEEVAQQFYNRCPKGVLDIRDLPDYYDPTERKIRSDRGKPRKKNRDQQKSS